MTDTLDGLGNWAGFDVDADGDGVADLEQQRAVNGANEITGVTEGQGQTGRVALTGRGKEMCATGFASARSGCS